MGYRKGVVYLLFCVVLTSALRHYLESTGFFLEGLISQNDAGFCSSDPAKKAQAI